MEKQFVAVEGNELVIVGDAIEMIVNYLSLSIVENDRRMLVKVQGKIEAALDRGTGDVILTERQAVAVGQMIRLIEKDKLRDGLEDSDLPVLLKVASKIEDLGGGPLSALEMR